MENYSIITSNLCKSYGTKTVVNNLNLSIKKGELFSLLGVNGAGKTTTIKMLSCLINPTKGDATLNGYSIIKDKQKVKAITNVSPQETAVAFNLTVYENLEFIAKIYGIKKEDIKCRVEKILTEFELDAVKNQKTKTLSGGYMRRLSIAMALITDPEILFLDEPTLGLDVIARRELWKTIKKLKEKVTIILTTHYLEEVVALATRVGIMSNGELKKVGTVDEIIESGNYQNFEDAFVSLATNGGECNEE